MVAVFTGCAGTEEKMGRGIRNTTEVVRLGDMRTSVEQTSVWRSPEEGCTVGVVRGFDHSLERTGLGIVEIITAPFPPYHPIFTKYIPAQPGHPDSYTGGLPDDPLFHSDHYVGFSGGLEGDFVPGSQFDVLGY